MNISPHFRSFQAIVVFLLLTAVVFSAKFKVESYARDGSEPTARRVDRQVINGKSCAPVKISTDLQGLSFQSGVGIAGDLLCKGGQYWSCSLPGELIICDVSGNDFDYCLNNYKNHYYESSPVNNPKGPYSHYRIIRGGSWYLDIKPGTNTFRNACIFSNSIQGFRCVRNV